MKTNRAQLDRLRFIDFVLFHFGIVRREMITDYFGPSIPQASLDIKAYIEAAPGNLEYDRSDKVYRKAASFKRKFH